MNALSFYVWCLVIIVSSKQVARSYRIIDIFFVHFQELGKKVQKKFQYTSKASRKHFTSTDILMKFLFEYFFSKRFYLLSKNLKLHGAIFDASWSVDKAEWNFCLGKMLNMCLIWLFRSSRKFAWNSPEIPEKGSDYFWKKHSDFEDVQNEKKRVIY